MERPRELDFLGNAFSAKPAAKLARRHPATRPSSWPARSAKAGFFGGFETRISRGQDQFLERIHASRIAQMFCPRKCPHRAGSKAVPTEPHPTGSLSVLQSGWEPHPT